MDPNYRASEDHWRLIENWPGLGEYPGNSCLLELRARIKSLEEDSTEQAESNRFCTDAIVARIEALEAAQQLADHIADASKMVAPRAPAGVQRRYPSPATIAECGGPCDSQGPEACDCGLLQELNPAPPAPAGELVDGICRQLPLTPGEVRYVLREVAAWLRSEPWLGRAAADRLEKEANR